MRLKPPRRAERKRVQALEKQMGEEVSLVFLYYLEDQFSLLGTSRGGTTIYPNRPDLEGSPVGTRSGGFVGREERQWPGIDANSFAFQLSPLFELLMAVANTWKWFLEIRDAGRGKVWPNVAFNRNERSSIMTTFHNHMFSANMPGGNRRAGTKALPPDRRLQRDGN